MIFVGNQRERTTSSRGFLSFLICLWQFCMFVHILSGPKTFLYIFFCFLPIFDREFCFIFSFVFFWSLTGNFFFLFFFFQCLIGNFIFFWKRVSNSMVNDSFFLGDPIVPSSEDRDGNSHPGSRFMVVSSLGSKGFQNGRTWCMPRCWFVQRFRNKGDVPYYFYDTHATMMIWKFYAKLVMHAPMSTLKHQVFMVMWH